MYIIPSTDPDAIPIVVAQGKPLTRAIKHYLKRLGKQFYFLVNSEHEEPLEKIELIN